MLQETLALLPITWALLKKCFREGRIQELEFSHDESGFTPKHENLFTS